MSSTNRSNARDNHVSDYYVTPPKPIRDLFSSLKETVCCDIFDVVGDNLNSQYLWLDPCAGGDEVNPMSYPFVLEELGVPSDNLTTIDIRDTSRAKYKVNFLDCGIPERKYDVVITNPPFNLAEEIINKSFDCVKDGGYVIMLLRLNFFGSKKRKEFWKDNMPILTFVHRERISFTKGATDSIEYMHCVWKKGVKQDYTKLMVI